MRKIQLKKRELSGEKSTRNADSDAAGRKSRDCNGSRPSSQPTTGFGTRPASLHREQNEQSERIIRNCTSPVLLSRVYLSHSLRIVHRIPCQPDGGMKINTLHISHVIQIRKYNFLWLALRMVTAKWASAISLPSSPHPFHTMPDIHTAFSSNWKQYCEKWNNTSFSFKIESRRM